ncbi:MAG: VacJ family lipoprotein [Mariprofundus sp.]
MRYSSHILILLLALTLSACATTQNHHDPIQPVNRVTDSVNDAIDRVTLKPLAQGYTAAVPKPMRTAVTNFYDNATYMNTVLNDFLQGKGAQGAEDFMRFLINTILGIGGLVDVATPMGFARHEEDFGQTLSTWGFSQGAYVVYPLLGPNSLRDTPDFITSTATNPLFWAGLVVAPYVTIPITALNYVDKRAQLLDASTMRDELALDPYVFTREAWRQNREFKIHDGHPPAPAVDEDDDWEEDDFDLEDATASEDTTNLEDTSDSENQSDMQDASDPKNNSDTEEMGSNLKTRISLSSAPTADTTIAGSVIAAAGSEIVPEESDTPLNDIPDATTSVQKAEAIYSIYLSSHYTEVEAAAEQGRITKLDIQTMLVPVTINQHVWYRLRASVHHDKTEALSQLKTLKSRTGLNGAWLEMEKQ